MTPGPSTVRPNILIADTRPERRAALAHPLDGRHELAGALHGRDALARLRSGEFEVALLALDLPLLSGAEVAARVAEEGLATRIVLHGEPGEALDVAGGLDNVVATLARPVAAIDVQRAVRRCLDPFRVTTVPPDCSGPIDRAPRLLVVDDDAQLCAALQDVLGIAFDVWTAGDGPEALRLARVRRFEVALVDLALPVLDGAWTAQRLRTILGDAKVLLMSGHERVGEVGGRIGAGVVRKPFHGHALLERLRRAVPPR
jgi:CheY-like chemotaxis protein